jgi:hypothetical protein
LLLLLLVKGLLQRGNQAIKNVEILGHARHGQAQHLREAIG